MLFRGPDLQWLGVARASDSAVPFSILSYRAVLVCDIYPQWMWLAQLRQKDHPNYFRP